MTEFALDLPPSIRLVEVGLRDGLQSVEKPLPTEQKLELIESLIAAGVTEIEAVSFAHPAVLPQLADAEAVMRAVPRPPGVAYRGLAPNLRGAQRALESGVDDVVVVVSADEGVSIRNQRRSVEQMLRELDQIGEAVAASTSGLIVAVACAFFAPTRGEVTREERLRVVDAASAAGARGVYLAGTTGQEHPAEFARGIAEVRHRHPELEIGVHLHNRNGFASANALVAMAAGADWIEAAFAGLGGDLWFPGDPLVLGNAPMEDLIHLCAGLGVRTGIDLDRYRAVADRVVELTGRPSASFVSRGGTRDGLAAASWPDDV